MDYARIRTGWRAAVIMSMAALVAGLVASPAAAVTVTSTERVSNGGTEFGPAVSGDGRFVVFTSDTRLRPDLDLDQARDVYLQDTAPGGGLELISQNTTLPADHPAITPDGRFVAFDTAESLVLRDRNSHRDVYRLDRATGQLELISQGSRGSLGLLGSGDSVRPSISADGNRVAFESKATTLVSGDTNGRSDVFVRDVDAGITFRASVSSTLAEATGGDSTHAAISGDGHHVAFASHAVNLVPGASGGNVFVRDTRPNGVTRWASRPVGAAVNDPSGAPAINHDGRVVVFQSVGNLHPDAGEALCSGPFAGRTADVFAFHNGTGALSVVSVPAAAAGHDQDDIATSPSISADGNRVAFTSAPLQLISCPNPHQNPDPPIGDEGPETVIGDDRIMIRDLSTGITVRVDRNTSGQFGNGPAAEPSVSADGTAVGYASIATNLAPGPAGSHIFRTRLG